MIHFDLPKEKSSIIKVIGVGGGGSNAVNHMFSQSIEGVNFIICNTDSQAIATSLVPNKIQLGPHLTQGLGAGANPQIGREATEESLEEIKRILEVNTKMAFITAGMGGGTGTGGAPIIAKICKDLGILTVGIVTTPFAYEGKKRIAQAEEGISKLKDHVDTLLVISNDKLRHQFGNLTMKAAFTKADNVLATAAKCITDVINTTGQINVDFADVCTVMRNGGVAILGSSATEGDNRAQDAIEQALNSPLLNDNDIRGAKWILININSSEGEHEFTMDEVETIQNHLLSQAGDDTDVILGLGYDNSLGSKIGITLIATGFEHKNPFDKKQPAKEEPKKEEKIMMVLGAVEEEKKLYQQPSFQFEDNPVIAPEESIGKLQLTDPMQPVIIDLPAFVLEQLPKEVARQEEDKMATILHFELTSEPEVNQAPDNIIPIITIPTHKDVMPSIDHSGTIPISSSYPARPSQIYAETSQSVSAETGEEQQSKVSEEPSPLVSGQVDEFVTGMHLVLKHSLEATEEVKESNVQQVQPIIMSSIEEPPVGDETDDIRRRSMERIAKLRNLSFNMNAADPNNEFESVPAYLRRNTELHNSIADVESFYSNYTVKSDENGQADISVLNTFMNGKRPD